MTPHHLTESDEAHWTGLSRVWSGVQQFPPKKRSSWWLVLAGVIIVTLAIAAR